MSRAADLSGRRIGFEDPHRPGGKCYGSDSRPLFMGYLNGCPSERIRDCIITTEADDHRVFAAPVGENGHWSGRMSETAEADGSRSLLYLNQRVGLRLGGGRDDPLLQYRSVALKVSQRERGSKVKSLSFSEEVLRGKGFPILSKW